MTRREQLDEVFKSVGEEQKQLLSPLLDEVVFLEERMRELKKLPFISVHPKNSSLQKTTSAAKIYKECTQSYMNAIRILSNLLKTTDTSAEDELLGRLEEFLK